MYSSKFSCTTKCTREGKPGENYAHAWILGDPSIPGGYSVEEVTSRVYTFNRVDADGNDATAWFSAINSLYAYARVLLIAIDAAGSYNDMGVGGVTFHVNGTVTVSGGVLASTSDLVGKTIFAYTVAGAPRDVQAGVATLTSGSAAVMFSPPFSGIPNVQATVKSPVSATVSASAVSASGFTLTVTPAPTEADPVEISWLAVYI